MIKGIAHACFIVNDLDISIQFYCGILGMKTAFDYVNDEGKRFGAYLHAGERNFLELFERSHGNRAENQSYQHLSLEVTDIRKMVENIRAGGIETSEIGRGKDRSWGVKFQDPDGNIVELQEYTEESKQEAWLRKS
jgi:lactoylglutathione lyase